MRADLSAARRRVPLVFLAAILAVRGFAFADSPRPSAQVFAVANAPGITEFVPAGYDPAKTPSLALQSEPQRQPGNATGLRVQPVFGQETAQTGTDPEGALFPAGAALETADIDAPAGTSFYGTGEVTGPLLRNNTTIGLWNQDNFNYKLENGARLYQSHPWVLGVRPDGSAFGVLFDTTWKARLHCGDHDIHFESQGPPFRVFVIDRASPEAVLQGLAQLIGTIPLPPLWALGFHQCRYSYYPDARVRQIADGFRSRHIPCDVIWLDIDYMNGYRVFTFDPQRFPDPPATFGYLHKHGFKPICMIDPGVKAEAGYAVYDSGSAADAWIKTADGKEYHGVVWPGPCVFPDFTSPTVRAWWGGLYKPFLGNGIDGIWNDMNEPSIFDTPDKTMPAGNLHRGGGGLPPGPHLEYHNVFGMLMVRGTRAGMQEANPEKRPFVLTRSNYLGGQRYGATWTGDNASRWDYLRESIPMSLNLGLSGQPFSGPDIGGFSGKATPELFGNWIGLGAFYPFSRAHKSKGEPNSEPWEFGPVVEAAARTALDRRYRLLPYLYTLFEEASRTGLPVMRPLFMADPKDMALRSNEQAFTLGRDLLVIPRWTSEADLPKGNWRAVEIVDAKLEADGYQPAVKIRPGAIVPLGKVIENTTQFSCNPLTLLVSLDENGHAEGWLYEDAGDGYGYRKGDYARLHYVADQSGNEVVVKIAGRNGTRKTAHGTVTVELVIGDHAVITGSGSDAEGIRCALR
jgi:alpha-glucosidase